MYKIKRKWRFALLGFLLFLLSFVLMGCKKAPSTYKIILSAPTDAVSKTENFNLDGAKVFRVQNDGIIVELRRNLDFDFKFKKVDGENFVYEITAVSYKDKTEVATSNPMYALVQSETAVINKPNKVYFNLTFNKVNEPTQVHLDPKGRRNNQNRYVFIHQYGDNYDINNIFLVSNQKTKTQLDAEAYNTQYPKAKRKAILTEPKGLVISAFYYKDSQIVYDKDLQITKDNLVKATVNENSIAHASKVKENKLKTSVTDVTNAVKEQNHSEYLMPYYYGKQGIGKGGYLQYDVTYSFELNGANHEVTHPVFTTGIKSVRPVHAKSGNWFDFILGIPMASILWLFGFGGSFGLAILLATILIRTLAWPIYAKTNDMSTKMQEAQPELNKLQEKYRGATDKQSQRAMQMEMLKIYRKHKIGFSTFILPFAQMPIFIAMYNAVQRVIIPGGYFANKFVRITNFMGFIDLTQGGLRGPDGIHWITIVLALLVGASMFALQKISSLKPKYMRGADKELQKTDQQKSRERTMKMVSVVMTVMMVVFALQRNAIAIYWIFGNIYSICQTLIQKAINKRKYLKKIHTTGLEV